MQYPQTRYQDTLSSGISDTAVALSVTTTAPARTQGILTLGRLQGNTEDVYFTNVVGNTVTIALRGLSTTALTPTQVIGNRKVHSSNESVEITTHHNYDTDKFRKSEDETITGKNTFTPVQNFTTPPKGGAAAASIVPSAPTAGTPTSGGSVNNGTHSYKVTFITAAGEESMPSSASGIITTGGGNNTVGLSGIPVGDANSNVTGRKIYRTIAGNTGNYKLLATLADNTTTVYSDAIADGSLGADAPTRATSYELSRYNEVMDTTSAQTVNGVKTFSSIPVGPASNPTSDNELTRKAYVDSRPAQFLSFSSYYLGENVLDRDALSTEDLSNAQGGSDANFGRDAASQGVYQAQSFIAGSAPVTFSMTVSLKKQGSPADNITVEIQTDSAGSPSGTAVTNGTSNTVVGSGLTGSYANTAFTWSSVPTLTAGTKYWLVLKRSGANSDTDYFQVQYSSVNAFRSGSAKKFTSSWTTNTGTDDDLVFAITGVTATAVKSIYNSYNFNRGYTAFFGFSRAVGTQGAQVESQTSGKMTGFSGLTRNSTYFVSATAGQITTAIQGVTIVGSALEVDTLVVGKVYLQAEFLAMTGEIKEWPVATPPTSWLLLDGSAVSRTTYSALFGVLSDTFGGGDGSTTFNLPDRRDRTPIGVNTSNKVVIDDCETAWTAGSNVTATADAVIFKTGTKSVKLAVAAGAGAGQILGYNTISVANLYGKTMIGFWFRSDIALNAGDLQYKLDDTAAIASALETINLPAIQANVWTKVYLTLSNPSLDLNLVSHGLYQVNDKGAFNLWIDDIAYGGNYEIGAKLGLATQTMHANEMPAHQHYQTTSQNGSGGGSGAVPNGTPTAHGTTGAFATGVWGGGVTQNNMQPSIGAYWIIKT